MSFLNEKCAHYRRKCALIAPCCDKGYRCRICHDENEDHNLERRNVKCIVCTQCLKQQEVAKNCSGCGVLFGSYSCLTCRLFDDVDKQQFHCVGCGICRVGGRENFFHCPKCDMCLGIQMKDTHKCIENSSRKNCPVCLEDIHTSRLTTHVPPCGHLIHTTCFHDMLKHSQSSCPVCNQSLIDMSSHWQHMDQIIDETPMPHIYNNYQVNILCRDCHEESKVLFHVVGLKCGSCGSYNTTRIGGDDPLPEEIPGENTLSELVSQLTDLPVSDSESWETVSENSSALGENEEIVLEDNENNQENHDHLTESNVDGTSVNEAANSPENS